MAGINELSGASSGIGSSGGALTAQRLATGEDFFKLLSAQLQAQDPLEPLKDTEFLGQLTQYNQLSQSLETNKRLGDMANLQESLAALQQMTQSAALIGKRAEFSDPSTGESKSGTVQGVRVDRGLVVLDVDGQSVPLTTLLSISSEA